MQREEAIKRLDNWLKVPVDYESILPALADLKYTDQFEDYIQRVAEIEYRSASSIADDVDHYITKVRYELEKNSKHSTNNSTIWQAATASNPKTLPTTTTSSTTHRIKNAHRQKILLEKRLSKTTSISLAPREAANVATMTTNTMTTSTMKNTPMPFASERDTPIVLVVAKSCKPITKPKSLLTAFCG